MKRASKLCNKKLRNCYKNGKDKKDSYPSFCLKNSYKTRLSSPKYKKK
jgi:hypothetical protein